MNVLLILSQIAMITAAIVNTETATPTSDTPDLPASATNQITTSFDDIDITRTPGFGKEAAAAADIICTPNLGAQELAKRHEIGLRKQEDFFNLVIAIARTDKNIKLEKTLQCQSRRNSIMMATCRLQANILLNDQPGILDQTAKRAKNIKLASSECLDIDPKLYAFLPVTTVFLPVTTAASLPVPTAV